MSADPLDALAQRLFQAARAERPAAALRTRVRELGAAELARSDAPPASGARGATRRIHGRRTTRWLAAAGLLSAAAAAFLFWGERTLQPEPEVHISAEARKPAVVRQRVPGAAASGLAPAEVNVPPHAPAAQAELGALPPTAAAPAKRSGARTPPPPATQPAPLSPAQSAAAPPAPSSESAPVLPLAQQLELLKQARALLRSGQSAQALTVLDRYGQLGGTDLRDEALLLRIEALAAQGQSAEAAELARRFASDHPDSPLAERARRLGGLR